MELRGFYELKRLVIGNFCFRYANNAVIEDMPELETLVLGDDCLNFSVLLQLISNTKLEKLQVDLPSMKQLIVRGKCLNNCTQIEIDSEEMKE